MPARIARHVGPWRVIPFPVDALDLAVLARKAKRSSWRHADKARADLGPFAPLVMTAGHRTRAFPSEAVRGRLRARPCSATSPRPLPTASRSSRACGHDRFGASPEPPGRSLGSHGRASWTQEGFPVRRPRSSPRCGRGLRRRSRRRLGLPARRSAPCRCPLASRDRRPFGLWDEPAAERQWPETRRPTLLSFSTPYANARRSFAAARV